MAMRLQELHPSLVHFPLALLPLAIGADLLGRASGNEKLLEAGRIGIGLAAGSAAIAGLAGLVAQQEVDAQGRALDELITHRNINLSAVAIAAGMAAWRMTRERPSAAYLALGLASMGAVTYSAYLGGHMVYELGVGVKPADGLKKEGTVPELTPSNLGHAAREAADDLAAGARLTVKEIGEGKLVPAITHHGSPSGDGTAVAGAGRMAAGASTGGTVEGTARPRIVDR